MRARNARAIVNSTNVTDIDDAIGKIMQIMYRSGVQNYTPTRVMPVLLVLISSNVIARLWYNNGIVQIDHKTKEIMVQTVQGKHKYSMHYMQLKHRQVNQITRYYIEIQSSGVINSCQTQSRADLRDKYIVDCGIAQMYAILSLMSPQSSTNGSSGLPLGPFDIYSSTIIENSGISVLDVDDNSIDMCMFVGFPRLSHVLTTFDRQINREAGKSCFTVVFA